MFSVTPLFCFPILPVSSCQYMSLWTPGCLEHQTLLSLPYTRHAQYPVCSRPDAVYKHTVRWICPFSFSIILCPSTFSNAILGAVYLEFTIVLWKNQCFFSGMCCIHAVLVHPRRKHPEVLFVRMLCCALNAIVIFVSWHKLESFKSTTRRGEGEGAGYLFFHSAFKDVTACPEYSEKAKFCIKWDFMIMVSGRYLFDWVKIPILEPKQQNVQKK